MFFSLYFFRIPLQARARKKKKHVTESITVSIFFSRAAGERSKYKNEKVGPYECNKLEKHNPVSGACYRPY